MVCIRVTQTIGSIFFFFFSVDKPHPVTTHSAAKLSGENLAVFNHGFWLAYSIFPLLGKMLLQPYLHLGL